MLTHEVWGGGSMEMASGAQLVISIVAKTARNSGFTWIYLIIIYNYPLIFEIWFCLVDFGFSCWHFKSCFQSFSAGNVICAIYLGTGKCFDMAVAKRCWRKNNGAHHLEHHCLHEHGIIMEHALFSDTPIDSTSFRFIQVLFANLCHNNGSALEVDRYHCCMLHGASGGLYFDSPSAHKNW